MYVNETGRLNTMASHVLKTRGIQHVLLTNSLFESFSFRYGFSHKIFTIQSHNILYFIEKFLKVELDWQIIMFVSRQDLEYKIFTILNTVIEKHLDKDRLMFHHPQKMQEGSSFNLIL